MPLTTTMNKGAGRLRVAVALLAIAVTRASAQEPAPVPEREPLVITSDFGGDAWVDANQPIGLRLSRPLDLRTERLAIVVGRTDLTALFMVTPTVARYAANTLPLPAGETEIAVYVVSRGQAWSEVARFPLRVRTRSGFHKADVNPGLTLTTNGQIAPERNSDGSKRPPYAGVTFNPAFTTALVNDNGTLELQSNFLAVTKQTQALRFGSQGNSAPKFDLSDYLIKGLNGPLSASLGHVSFGSARHLISGVASRGITAGLRVGKIGEVSFGALNGSSIVGWDNPLGLAETTHRIFGATLKVDALTQHPGAMLFDLSLLDGAQLPRSGFSQGEVNDRERNRGAALHFTGKTAGDRLSLDAGYTVSRFENPSDPALEQGLTLVPVRPETRGARFADLSLAILRDAHLSKSVLANLRATLRHERVDPLYRSLAASVQANVLENVLELAGGVGPLALQASHARSEDNLDDLASVLKTFTHVTSMNASLPIGALISASKPSAWLPQLTWTLSTTHQFAKDVPENSDFTETHAPDQVSDNQSADLQWNIGRWRAGYRYNISTQDNRQVGREKSDLNNLAHNLAAAFSPRSWLDIGATFAFEGAKNKEFSQENETRRVGANLDLRPTRNLGLSAVYARTWTADDPRTSENADDDLSIELSQSLKLLRGIAERPSGRLFMRYQRQSAKSTAFLNSIREAPISRRTWALNSGVSINAF
jgi:hypothetical protein